MGFDASVSLVGQLAVMAIIIVVAATMLTPMTQGRFAASAAALIAIVREIALAIETFSYEMVGGHYGNVIDGLVAEAAIHAEHVASTPPRPGGPHNHWKTEIKAMLSRALRLAKKYLRGKRKQQTIEQIQKIADKANVPLD